MNQVSASSSTSSQNHSLKYMLTLSLGALGVVYGDIGTSVLYSMRECFFGPHAVPVTYDNILGVLSLIFWALIVMVSLKYILYVMRADNNGEGGVLALMALAHPRPVLHGRDKRRFIIILGLIGAALLYGDGMITPAISVLSAVEGLKIATPMFEPYVIPITIAVLCLLFMPQRFGTAKVGTFFGPIILVWFFTLGILGVSSLITNPSVLIAVNPYYALHFFVLNGWHGFLILGSVVLVVTGGEALYADMGHFGKAPIRWGWFSIVLPSLVLNYFGQGALLLSDPSAAENPFFRLAPNWFMLPLVGLSTMAAIIASQALISGTYSLTRQAIQLGYLPRQQISHTSEEEIGQIYVPSINWGLLISTIALVVMFRTSSGLAAAYGVAVTMTMVITTLLMFFVAHERWRWSILFTLCITAFFLVFDLSFLIANLVKIWDGGWFPLAIGGVIFTAMTTWQRGRFILAQRLKERVIPLEQFFRMIKERKIQKIDGTAVFMTSTPEGTPPALLHNAIHNKVIHSNVILITVITASVPFVKKDDRFELHKIRDGFFFLTVRYGFMDSPNVPAVLARCQSPELDFKLREITYFLGRETLISTRRPGMARWRERLFAFMTKNAQRATTFFRLPPDQVFEIGIEVEI